MKKKTNFILLTLLLILCGAFFGITQKVEAATVTKVTHVVKTYQTSGFPKQYTLITGKTSSGKTVQTYKTKACATAGGRSATLQVKGSSVYIVDDKTFVRLSKQTGKVLAKKSSKYLYGWMGAMAVDNNGNSYSMGKYATYLVKVNKSGTVKWKCNMNAYNGYDFADKVTVSGNKVTVRFGYAGGKVVVNASTGKVMQYIR